MYLPVGGDPFFRLGLPSALLCCGTVRQGGPVCRACEVELSSVPSESTARQPEDCTKKASSA